MCMLTVLIPRAELDPKLYISLLGFVLRENASASNKDGTGVSVRNGFIKWNSPAEDVIFSNDYTGWLMENFEQKQPVFGHVRAVSTGRKAKDGAHPFSVGNLLMAHNGTISNYHELLKKLPEGLIDDDDPVDSHVLTAALAVECAGKAMTFDAIKEVLGSVYGSYALLAYDEVSSKSWVIRGSNSLAMVDFGDFAIINTAEYKVKTVAKELGGLFEFLFNYKIPDYTVTQLSTHTAFIIEDGKLETVGDLPKELTYTRQVSNGRPSMNMVIGANRLGPLFEEGEEKDISDAIRWINVLSRVLDLEGVTLSDLEIISDLAFDQKWYQLEFDTLLQIGLALTRTHQLYADEDKTKEWAVIQDILGEGAYFILGKDHNIEVPWYLNDYKTLKAIRDEYQNEYINILGKDSLGLLAAEAAGGS